MLHTISEQCCPAQPFDENEILMRMLNGNLKVFDKYLIGQMDSYRNDDSDDRILFTFASEFVLQANTAHDDDDEVIKTVFRNGKKMGETRHQSYYTHSEGFIGDQGGKTLVRPFQLF